MKKDDIIKYIQLNKEQFDLNEPDHSMWTEIEINLQQSSRSNKKYLLILSAAILAGLAVFTYQYFNPTDKVPLSIEADSDYFQHDSLLTNKSTRNEKLVWNSAHENSYYVITGRINSPPLGTVSYSTNLNYSITQTYLWANSNSTITQITDENSGYPLGYYFEEYDEFVENKPQVTLGQPISTFGIDVDGASYSHVRRFLKANYLPPKDAVKLEEMVNYFDYNLPAPNDDQPFSVTTEISTCPWNENNQLMMIALKGKEMTTPENRHSNLVFLIDVSGSMDQEDKLPLLKESLNLLVDEMTSDDFISIVTYSGDAQLVLSSTNGENKEIIKTAINSLHAGGTTAGESGIEMAYQVARKNYNPEGNNRVILATDGDFNVGISDDDDLIDFIGKKRDDGIFLTVLGFGSGNIKNSKMENLADNGNGNYYFIDHINEAKRVLVSEMQSTMHVIAKDVKLQIELNPALVSTYRLLGYENRVLSEIDFIDDKKDSGDMGEGHEVIVFYEIVPADKNKSVELKYNNYRYFNNQNLEINYNNEWAFLKIKYKNPKSDISELLEIPILHNGNLASETFNFASSVIEFGLLLRNSTYKANAQFKHVYDRASKNLGSDNNKKRAEFLQLVERGWLLMQEYMEENGYHK